MLVPKTLAHKILAHKILAHKILARSSMARRDMMSEKSALRSVALMVASLCLIAFATTAFGCASSSGAADDGAEERAQKVSGEPPSPQEDTQKPLPKGPKVEIGNAPSDVEPADVEPADAEPADASDGEAAGSFTRSEVQAFMQKGPSYALTMVRVQPERVDGKFQGFKVIEMKPGAASTVAPQLVKGDVITHINGVRMEKPDDYLNAWKLLSEVSTIRVDFVRDGTSDHAVWNIQ
jgi:hypothetical protein